MKTFHFLFGAILGEMLLRHFDNLSKTFQKKTISAAEGQQVGRMVVDTLQSLRAEESYDLFWTKVGKVAGSIDVEEPRLSRDTRSLSALMMAWEVEIFMTLQRHTTASFIMKQLTMS